MFKTKFGLLQIHLLCWSVSLEFDYQLLVVFSYIPFNENKQAEKLKSREMEHGWMKNDERWMKNDDGWRMNDEGWWLPAVEGFCRLTD